MIEHLTNEKDWQAFKEDHLGKNEILIFKYSPICPTSRAAENRFDDWYDDVEDSAPATAKVNVIDSRALARGLADELGVRHESPQALWLGADGQVKWHASHGAITAKSLNDQR